MKVAILLHCRDDGDKSSQLAEWSVGASVNESSDAVSRHGATRPDLLPVQVWWMPWHTRWCTVWVNTKSDAWYVVQVVVADEAGILLFGKLMPCPVQMSAMAYLKLHCGLLLH